VDLSIITVTHQSREYIDACILSVVAHTLDCNFEHLIVDNHSDDGTVELIEKCYASHVKLIKNLKNRGFAAANHQALSIARGRYLLFLNPDMQLHKGFLDSLISWMDENPCIGLASCKLLNGLQRPSQALRPSHHLSLFPYLPALLKLRPFFCTVHPQFFYPNFDDDKEQDVDTVRGAFMLLRKEVVDKLGFAFDPRYFLLFEDVDLCREVKKLRYRVVYTPRMSCIDYFGRSFHQKTLAWKYLCMAKGLVTYVKKWHSPLHLFWLYPLLSLGFLLRIPDWGLKNSLTAFKIK
jgi:GT2 family glycosyltransferase